MKAKWPLTINVILNIWLRHSFKAGIETLPVYRSNSLSTWWYKIKNWKHLKLLRLKARLNYTYNSAGAPWGMAGCSAPHREHGNERRHGVRGQRVSWTGNTQYGERHYPVLLNCKIVHHGLLAVLIMFPPTWWMNAATADSTRRVESKWRQNTRDFPFRPLQNKTNKRTNVRRDLLHVSYRRISQFNLGTNTWFLIVRSKLRAAASPDGLLFWDGEPGNNQHNSIITRAV